MDLQGNLTPGKGEVAISRVGGPVYLSPSIALTKLIRISVHEGRSTLHSMGIHTELLRIAFESSPPEIAHRVGKSSDAINRSINNLTSLFDRCSDLTQHLGKSFKGEDSNIPDEDDTVLIDMSALGSYSPNGVKLPDDALFSDYCSPIEVLRGVVHDLEKAGLGGESKLFLSLEDDCQDKPLLVKMNAPETGEAFWQLIVNALDVSPAGERVLVKGSRILLGVQENFCLMVEDGGPGITPERFSTIYRIGGSTKPGRLGLGLPLTRQIISEASGEIILEPVGERGLRALLYLPIVAQ